MATENDTGMLSAEDRRKARDCARWLLDGMLEIATANVSAATVDAVEMRDLAAAIRDLDAVARGPVT